MIISIAVIIGLSAAALSGTKVLQDQSISCTKGHAELITATLNIRMAHGQKRDQWVVQNSLQHVGCTHAKPA